MTLTEAAHAKLNLALHVRRRRPDGYHDLETIFAFTALGDVLSAEPADGLSLTIDGPFAAGLSPDEDNLILRAARALQNAAHPEPFGCLPRQAAEGLGMSGSAGASIHLTKNLPVASGIGGGSADAAAALRLLDRLWSLGRPLADLAAIGATLGADVPACVHGRTLRGEGRGDALVPIDLGLAGAPVLLVNPGVAVSTAAVFKAWDGVDRGPLDAMADSRNDLQPAARSIAPEIGEVLAALGARPEARLVRMSGSGATCFAIFNDEASCESAALVLARPGWWVARTRLL